MAKNWNPKEAAVAIKEGNMSAIKDFGGRFPLASTTLAAAIAGDEAAILLLIAVMDERNVNMRAIETVLKNGVEDSEPETEDEEDVEEEEEEEKPKKKGGKGKKPVAEEEDEDEEEEEEESDEDAELTLKDLRKMKLPALKKFAKDMGVDIDGMKRGEIEEAILNFDEDAADDEDEDGADSSEMDAKELYKECKDRGLKVAKGKKESYYIGKLEEDDENSEGEDDGDWGDWD